MTGGWERVRPQRVRHADGYQVYSVGRFEIGYEDAEGKAIIPVEPLASGVGIDPRQIVRVDSRGAPIPVDDVERDLILQRTVEGLAAMGTQSVIGHQ